MVMKMEKSFETHDLYLASALKICGFRLINLKFDEKGRGSFVFEDRNDRFQVVRGYFSGELKGSLKDFSNAWADLKSLLIAMQK
jgi:hypothetical protein